MVKVVSFNRQEIPAFLKVTGISFPVLGNSTPREITIPGRVGNRDNKPKIGGKLFKLDVLLKHDPKRTILDQSDDLKRWIRGNNWEPSQFILGDQPNKFYKARVTNSVDIDDLFIHGTGSIEFYASDPIKYDTSKVVINSFIKNGNTISFDYSGLEMAPVTFELTPTLLIKNLSIKHRETGKSLHIIGDLAPTRPIVIDCNSKIIRYDNYVNMNLLSFSSDWLYLQEGMNTFEFSAKSWGTTLDLSKENPIKISYRQGD